MHNATFEGPQPVCTQTSPTLSGPGVAVAVDGIRTGMGGNVHVQRRRRLSARVRAALRDARDDHRRQPVAAAAPAAPAGARRRRRRRHHRRVPHRRPRRGTAAGGRAGAAASGLKVAATQTGTVVRGSLLVARPGSRLDVRLSARRTALGSTRQSGSVSVGRLRRTSVGGRRVEFAVKLSSAAKRALRRDGRLAITLRLTVTPPTGDVYSATRKVGMRRNAGRSASS